ncbi:hypothetical protein RDI58_028947 [Solanum bulbocastanum]|uniref:DUF4216 domain-containing protein n=1 Tax=Solanum bulbocastanum TaxID=147425 RepID=A0AAN8XZH3_SOLBU
MDVKGKTKDYPKARMDIKKYCRRKELWLQELQNCKIVKPKANFSFTLDEKREIIEWVKNSRMPEGYASNLGKRADMNEGKWIGVKSHDCYMFKETLIPIAFSHLSERIWKPITEVYDEYSSVQHLQLVKEVALGSGSQVLTMNKYCVNGFKFQTEEVSRNMKTNNSGVYIQGDVDGIGQTIEYYGVIQEIIEVRYLGWPKKKIVLFRCEWFDPSHRRTKELPSQCYKDLPLQAIRRARPLLAGTLSPTATPSATPHDTMSALAPGQKDRPGRVMIEPNGSL